MRFSGLVLVSPLPENCSRKRRPDDARAGLAIQNHPPERACLDAYAGSAGLLRRAAGLAAGSRVRRLTPLLESGSARMPVERLAAARGQVRLPGVDDSRDLRKRAGGPAGARRRP